ncbi:MAG: hypothetical protein IJ251_08705 [Oscillospiraceae bacterium]|nr:hypothetical protein [Oscillospiraceae bacterium]
MNFAYVVVLFFGLIGLWALLYDVPGFLLYHREVQARAKNGKRYISANAKTRTENRSRGQYGKPDGDVRVKSATFTYEENGKAVIATAVNLLGDDNLYLENGRIYTIKVSPFDPHKCYFPAGQLYQGCSIPAKVFIFVKRAIPKFTGILFVAIAWFAYTNFIID